MAAILTESMELVPCVLNGRNRLLTNITSNSSQSMSDKVAALSLIFAKTRETWQEIQNCSCLVWVSFLSFINKE